VSARVLRLLLWLYPPAWRARYGEELDELVGSARAEQGTARIALDLVVAAGRERLRSAGLIGDGITTADRERGGVLLVLAAWSLFVLGGIGVEKASEQWQAAVTGAGRALPAHAFDLLVGAAVGGCLLTLAGITLALGSLRTFLRHGGWRRIRVPILRASALTLATGVALIPLMLWAQRLNVAQRNGHDTTYAVAIALFAALFALCLGAWTLAAVTTARQLDLTPQTLAAEKMLAAGVTAAMCVMTGATAVWWGALASRAPWFFTGTRPGSAGSVLPLNLVVPVVLMLLATVLGALGTRRSFAARHAEV